MGINSHVYTWSVERSDGPSATVQQTTMSISNQEVTKLEAPEIPRMAWKGQKFVQKRRSIRSATDEGSSTDRGHESKSPAHHCCGCTNESTIVPAGPIPPAPMPCLGMSK